MLLLSGFAFSQSQPMEVFMCKLTSLKIKAESTGAHHYEWYRNNEVVVGSTTGDLVVSQEGTYKAFGVNESGCLSDVSISIIVRNHTPTAVNDEATGKKNIAVMLDVLKNDLAVCADLDPATLAVVQQPTNGTIVKINGQFQFTPQNDFVGLTTFTYTVTDKTGMQSNIANVRVDIQAAPLPVTLVHFNVNKVENSAVLDWRTSQEENSDYFEIERSSDAKSWQKISAVDAAFETDQVRDYNYTDSLPESGTNYYRLRMVDADNTFAYSKVRSVYFPEFSWAQVYPNPVEDQLNIVIRNSKVKKMRMISQAGVVYYSRQISGSSFKVNMQQYPSGMYYIHFEQEDGAVKIYKLMHN